jgi:hypothetical protein
MGRWAMNPDKDPVDEAAATDAFFSEPAEAAEPEEETPPAKAPAPAPATGEAPPPAAAVPPPGGYVRDIQLEFEEQEEEGKV